MIWTNLGLVLGLSYCLCNGPPGSSGHWLTGGGGGGGGLVTTVLRPLTPLLTGGGGGGRTAGHHGPPATDSTTDRWWGWREDCWSPRSSGHWLHYWPVVGVEGGLLDTTVLRPLTPLLTGGGGGGGGGVLVTTVLRPLTPLLTGGGVEGGLLVTTVLRPLTPLLTGGGGGGGTAGHHGPPATDPTTDRWWGWREDCWSPRSSGHWLHYWPVVGVEGGLLDTTVLRPLTPLLTGGGGGGRTAGHHGPPATDSTTDRWWGWREDCWSPRSSGHWPHHWPVVGVEGGLLVTTVLRPLTPLLTGGGGGGEDCWSPRSSGHWLHYWPVVGVEGGLLVTTVLLPLTPLLTGGGGGGGTAGHHGPPATDSTTDRWWGWRGDCWSPRSSGHWLHYWPVVGGEGGLLVTTVLRPLTPLLTGGGGGGGTAGHHGQAYLSSRHKTL